MTEAIEIMNAINEAQSRSAEAHAELAKQIGDLNKNIGELQVGQKSLRNELFADGGRVRNLEDALKDARKRQWLHTVVILPVSVALKAVLDHFGIKI